MKHEADNNFDQDKAMEIIDDNLDNETQCDPESTRLLAQWVKSSPENADEVFKRFILHALLKDHYQQQSYSDMLHTGAGFTPPSVKLSAGAYRLRKLIRYSVLALAMLAVITAAVYIDRNRTGITDSSKVRNPYAVNMPHCQVLTGSEWGGDFTAPDTMADIIGKRYNLFSGYAWFRLNPDCVFYMMGGSCVRPQRSDYVYIESGRFLFDTTMPDKSLSVELANVIINPNQALFCVGYNKEYDCTDIYVLSGEIELAAKADFFDYYQLSATGQNSATLSTDGFVPGVEKEIQNYFGPLLGLPTLAAGPVPTLDLQFIYEGFDYDQPESATAGQPVALHHLNGGWGWSGPWRELGSLDSQIIFDLKTDSSGSPDHNLSFIDAAGTRLAGKPGTLLTAAGPHSHCRRKIGMNIVPPALLTEDNKIGQDHSVLWLSFLAQADNIDAGGQDEAYLYLGSYDEGIMLGQSQIIKSGHWSLQSISGKEKKAFRIDNDYRADRRSFFVVRISFLPGAEEVSIWLDPKLGLQDQLPQESLQVRVADFRFNEIGIYANKAISFDEIRLGTSFESVTQIAP